MKSRFAAQAVGYAHLLRPLLAGHRAFWALESPVISMASLKSIFGNHFFIYNLNLFAHFVEA